MALRKLAANRECLITEHLEEFNRQIQERYAAECGPVTESIDINCLESLTAQKGYSTKSGKEIPGISIQAKRLRFTGAISRHFTEKDTVEILASPKIIAVRKNTKNGIPCRFSTWAAKQGRCPALLVSRVAVIRRLVDLGWQVGSQVVLQWDEGQQAWWGKRPDKKEKEKETRRIE